MSSQLTAKPFRMICRNPKFEAPDVHKIGETPADFHERGGILISEQSFRQLLIDAKKAGDAELTSSLEGYMRHSLCRTDWIYCMNLLGELQVAPETRRRVHASLVAEFHKHLEDPNYLLLSVDALHLILNEPNLHCTEFEILEVLMRWFEHKDNWKYSGVASELFSLIHFSKIGQEQLIKICQQAIEWEKKGLPKIWAVILPEVAKEYWNTVAEQFDLITAQSRLSTYTISSSCDVTQVLRDLQGAKIDNSQASVHHPHNHGDSVKSETAVSLSSHWQSDRAAAKSTSKDKQGSDHHAQHLHQQHLEVV